MISRIKNAAVQSGSTILAPTSTLSTALQSGMTMLAPSSVLPITGVPTYDLEEETNSIKGFSIFLLLVQAYQVVPITHAKLMHPGSMQASVNDLRVLVSLLSLLLLWASFTTFEHGFSLNPRLIELQKK